MAKVCILRVFPVEGGVKEANAVPIKLSALQNLRADHGGVFIRLNSLTTEKQTIKFSSANFQKMLSPSYIILRTQRLQGK